jgi:hypothetical protein
MGAERKGVGDHRFTAFLAALSGTQRTETPPARPARAPATQRAVARSGRGHRGTPIHLLNWLDNWLGLTGPSELLLWVGWLNQRGETTPF